MIFLSDKEQAYSYDDLLRSVIEGTVYYPYYKTSDVYSYFVNLIKAIVTGQPLVLLDSDINHSEIDDLDDCKVNVAESIAPASFQSMDEVVAAVQNSKSEITIFTAQEGGA